MVEKIRMNACMVYARSQGTVCTGDCECHWCGSKCGRQWIHDDPPRLVGQRPNGYSKIPNSPFICAGCWLFRRKRITVPFLHGGYKDSQSPRDYSWLITPDGAWAIIKDSFAKLYEKLISPPPIFCLSLLDGKIENRLQLAFVNQNEQVRADSSFDFTINNIKHTYSIYELEEALKSGDSGGVEPGVRALITLLGPTKLMAFQSEEKKGRGRPVEADKATNRLRRTVKED